MNASIICCISLLIFCLCIVILSARYNEEQQEMRQTNARGYVKFWVRGLIITTTNTATMAHQHQ